MSMIADADRERIDRIQWAALVAGIACIVVCCIGAIWQSEQFYRVWLVNFQCVTDLALGSWSCS